MEPGEHVLSVVRHLVGGAVRVIEALVDHHERCVLHIVLPDGQSAIVKGDLDPERSDREARVLEAARGAGVPVPAVLARSPGPPSVLVLSQVGGAWLAPERGERAWRAAGSALRGLHRTPVPGLREHADQADWASGVRWMLDYWESDCLAAGLPVATFAAVRAVAAAGDDCPGELLGATLHGDCMPIHVHLDEHDHVVALLDLGEASRGDPAWDIAVLTLRSPERLRAVLDGYGAGDELRAWIRRVLPAYGAFRLVVEVGWLAAHGFDPGGAAREVASAARVLGT